jgi:hypothetical protein
LFSEAARDNDPDKLKLAETVLAKNRLRQNELTRHLPPAY